MLTNLRIRNFRSFKSLSVEGLTRINLFVGANNAGKTSILESAEALLVATPRALWGAPNRREEYLTDPEERGTGPELDIRHLFFGHRLMPGSSFRIEGQREGSLFFECEVVSAPDSASAEQTSLPLPERLETEPPLALRLQWSGSSTTQLLPLSPQGGLTHELRRRIPPTDTDTSKALPVVLLAPGSLAASKLGGLWDSVVLTPEEPRVISALRLIEPEVERIAAVARSRYGSGGILVKLRDSDERIPLGSMGDGLRYLLSLSLALVGAQGGCLLVDEIDTGLHYAVMGKMWELIIQSAKRLELQVIATTHSLDCLRSLASVCRRGPLFEAEVSVHRIERGDVRTTCYSAVELAAAIEQEMEIR